jgi:hypothetical protein
MSFRFAPCRQRQSLYPQALRGDLEFEDLKIHRWVAYVRSNLQILKSSNPRWAACAWGNLQIFKSSNFQI